jgi:hypothetical protein
MAEHLIVATGLRHHLTILHEHADFSTVVVPDIQQQRKHSRRQPSERPPGVNGP